MREDVQKGNSLNETIPGQKDNDKNKETSGGGEGGEKQKTKPLGMSYVDCG